MCIECFFCADSGNVDLGYSSGSLARILSMFSISFHGHRFLWYLLKRTVRSACQCSSVTVSTLSQTAGLLLVPLSAVVNFHVLEW